MDAKFYNDYVVRNWGRKKTSDGHERNPLEHLTIMSLGLPGEVGEALEHVKKFVRDGRQPGDDFALECGDALHYLVRLANEFGYTLQDLMRMNVEKLDARYGKSR